MREIRKRKRGRRGVREREGESMKDLVMTGHVIIITMYIYRALINALSAHMIILT